MKKLSLRRSFYFLAVLCFFALFSKQSYEAFRKFTSGRTGYQSDWLVNIFLSFFNTQTRFSFYVCKEEDELMYPSISVCKKWAFDYASLDFENEEYSHENVSTFIGWVNEYSVRMEDQFYFFTLPEVKNLTFPCTTIAQPWHSTSTTNAHKSAGEQRVEEARYYCVHCAVKR